MFIFYNNTHSIKWNQELNYEAASIQSYDWPTKSRGWIHDITGGHKRIVFKPDFNIHLT